MSQLLVEKEEEVQIKAEKEEKDAEERIKVEQEKVARLQAEVA